MTDLDKCALVIALTELQEVLPRHAGDGRISPERIHEATVYAHSCERALRADIYSGAYLRECAYFLDMYREELEEWSV